MTPACVAGGIVTVMLITLVIILIIEGDEDG